MTRNDDGTRIDDRTPTDDRVVAVLPDIAETVIAMLGTSALGGVFSSASPDFGEQGLLDRFAQVDPKILIACDGYQYSGKTVDIRERISAVVEQLPTVEHVVIVPYMDLGVPDGMLDWGELTKARRSGTNPRGIIDVADDAKLGFRGGHATEESPSAFEIVDENPAGDFEIGRPQLVVEVLVRVGEGRICLEERTCRRDLVHRLQRFSSTPRSIS